MPVAVPGMSHPLDPRLALVVDPDSERSAAFRVLQLLSGVGPATARDALTHLSGSGWNFASLNAF